jgi:hypothetical protein
MPIIFLIGLLAIAYAVALSYGPVAGLLTFGIPCVTLSLLMGGRR